MAPRFLQLRTTWTQLNLAGLPDRRNKPLSKGFAQDGRASAPVALLRDSPKTRYSGQPGRNSRLHGWNRDLYAFDFERMIPRRNSIGDIQPVIIGGSCQPHPII